MNATRAACAWSVVLVAGCSFQPGVSSDANVMTNDGSDAPAGPDAPSLSEGLIAWYEAETIASATALDSTGHGHTGSCAACPTIVPGHLGSAFSFSGGPRIDVIDNGAFVTLTGFTVAAWVRFEQVPGSGYACPLGKVFGNQVNNSYQLCYDAGPNSWLYVSTPLGAGIDFLNASIGPSTHTWYHTAMTWDGTTKQLWIDGRSVASKSVAIGFDTQPFTLGADIDNGSLSAPFTGFLDDVRIYDHALSADLMVTLAAQ